MNFKKLPKQEFLHSILDYDQKTGIFKWKNRKEYGKNWNTKYAGKIAGQPHSNGYWNILINYSAYRAHRLAWVYIHGDVLDGDTEIDHKNNEKSDNRINNLRLASKGKNMANIGSRGKSGLPKGVERNKKRFSARILSNGVRYNLGTYDTPAEAHEAYKNAALKYHGEFARAS